MLADAMDRSDPTEPHTSSLVDESVAGLRMHALEMGALVMATQFQQAGWTSGLARAGAGW